MIKMKLIQPTNKHNDTITNQNSVIKVFNDLHFAVIIANFTDEWRFNSPSPPIKYATKYA